MGKSGISTKSWVFTEFMTLVFGLQIKGVIEFYEQMNANLTFQYDNTIRTLIVQGCVQRSLAAIG
jgi:hypothetical protein